MGEGEGQGDGDEDEVHCKILNISVEGYRCSLEHHNASL